MDEIVNSDVELTEDELALLDTVLEEAHNEDAHDDDTNILPLNSPTLLIDESSSRFSSATWFEEIKKQIVTLAGLGGIGSYVAFLLGRLKIQRLSIYDNDFVDGTNLSGQLFSNEDIGSSKVNAVCRILRSFSGFYPVYSSSSRYGIASPTDDIMICGFDSMESRKLFFGKWKNHVSHTPQEDRANCLFIDGRLAAEEFQVFCIKGTDTFLMEKYEKEWLFDDSEAEETLCSYKQTSFCANMIASVIVNLFVNFVANKCNPLIERELPFYISYDAERMILKTEAV